MSDAQDAGAMPSTQAGAFAGVTVPTVAIVSPDAASAANYPALASARAGDLRERIVQLWADGVSLTQIAHTIGRTRDFVAKRRIEARNAGDPRAADRGTPGGAPARAGGSFIWTPAEIEEIRRMRAAKMSSAAIASALSAAFRTERTEQAVKTKLVELRRKAGKRLPLATKPGAVRTPRAMRRCIGPLHSDGTMFESSGPHERICPACKLSVVWAGGTLA